jgi:hypothetical protein
VNHEAAIRASPVSPLALRETAQSCPIPPGHLDESPAPPRSETNHRSPLAGPKARTTPNDPER